MKTTFKEIVDHPEWRKFVINSKVYDLGRQAEIIQSIAEDAIIKDGEHSKIHCSNIIRWMQEIADQAERILKLRLDGEKE